MIYYKNIEISSTYGVSKPTITKWIKDTLEGKKSLELTQVKEKYFITKTDKNIQLIEEYVEQGFKYKPKNAREVAEPKVDYIKYLSTKQRIEIKKSLTEKRALDMKFAYVDGGSLVWDMIYNHSQGGSMKLRKQTDEFNTMIVPYILKVSGDKKINVIDIGPGNGKKSIELIENITKIREVNKYISFDISSEMNKLTQKNFDESLPDLDTSFYVLDIENESFEEIAFQVKRKYPDTINLILLAGGLLGNLSNPGQSIRNIEKSMSVNDLLYIANPYVNEQSYYNQKYIYEKPTSTFLLFPSRALGLNVAPENIEYTIDKDNNKRNFFVRLPKDHTIKFPIEDDYENIDLTKDMLIKIGHVKMTSLEEITEITKPLDLHLINYTLSSDGKTIITIHRKEAKK